MAFFRDNMKYIEFSKNNPRCIHCFINERAYASVITEVMTNGQNETGGVFLGYIVNRAWYIVESVDPGMDTVNQVAFFQWDTEYVNHQAERLSKIYNKPLTVLGFWHRHPGSMDYFSGQDETTIRSNLKELRAGLLSMLVNIDPKLRMTFYYCYDNDIMPIRYDVGNKYFPAELMKYADAEELSRRAADSGRFMDIHYEQVINLEAVAARKKAPTENLVHENKKEVTSYSAKTNANREIHRQTNSYSSQVSDDTIRRIVEIVVGIEGDTNTRIEQLSGKVSALESTLEVLLKRTEEILKNVNPKEKSDAQEAISQEILAKIVKITAESIAEQSVRTNQILNQESEMVADNVSSETKESEVNTIEMPVMEVEDNSEKTVNSDEEVTEDVSEE